jgi:small subunit ribosomal protein S14
MAKKSIILRNEKRKKFVDLYKNQREILLSKIKDEKLSFDERLTSQIKLSKLPKDSSVVRYRNRCSITGRPRGNFRKFGICRIVLRDLASWGRVPGLVKSSW